MNVQWFARPPSHWNVDLSLVHTSCYCEANFDVTWLVNVSEELSTYLLFLIIFYCELVTQSMYRMRIHIHSWNNEQGFHLTKILTK